MQFSTLHLTQMLEQSVLFVSLCFLKCSWFISGCRWSSCGLFLCVIEQESCAAGPAEVKEKFCISYPKNTTFEHFLKLTAMVVLCISINIHCFLGLSYLVRCFHFTAHSHCWLGLSTSTTSNVQHHWRDVTWSWHATVSLSRFSSLQCWWQFPCIGPLRSNNEERDLVSRAGDIQLNQWTFPLFPLPVSA